MSEVNDISNPKLKKRKAPLTEFVIVDDNVTNTSQTSEELLAAAPNKLLGFKKDQASVTEKVIDDTGARKKSSCSSDYTTKLQNSRRANNRLKKKMKELKKTVNELKSEYTYTFNIVMCNCNYSCKKLADNN